MSTGEAMVQFSECRPGDPERLGPWEVKARIGAGGMGVVYHGVRDGRSAAVKMVRPGLLEDAATQVRFAREVEVLRRVRDVHISEFIDADVRSDPAWLATALVYGNDLKSEVEANGPLPEDQWWQVAHGLAQALAVLEVHGVIHRDVKPSNVILSDTGPVLIDFGIANPEDAASLTSTGLVAGSPAWLSPEQADLGPVSAASDVFSLGSLLAYAATGRPPFGQGAQIATLYAIATKEPDLAGCSPHQWALLTRMLQKRPADRPSARQVLAWTKDGGAGVPAIQGGAPGQQADATAILAPPAAAAAAAGSATGTLPGTPAADPTSVLAPTGAAAATAPPADRTAVAPATPAAPAQRPPARSAPPARKRSWGWLWVVLVVLVLAGGGWLLLGRDGGGPGGTGGSASPEPIPTPSPTGVAPSADVLRSGDWLLSSYSIGNEGGILSVAATLQNQGDASASGDIAVQVYADGVYVGTVTATVADVPAGGSVEVDLTGDAAWQAGDPTLVLSVS